MKKHILILAGLFLGFIIYGCQDSSQITPLLDRRTRGDPKVDLHLVRQNMRQSRLAQSRRAVEQDMVERFFPLSGCFDQDRQVLLYLILPDQIR